MFMRRARSRESSATRTSSMTWCTPPTDSRLTTRSLRFLSFVSSLVGTKAVARDRAVDTLEALETVPDRVIWSLAAMTFSSGSFGSTWWSISFSGVTSRATSTS